MLSRPAGTRQEQSLKTECIEMGAGGRRNRLNADGTVNTSAGATAILTSLSCFAIIDSTLLMTHSHTCLILTNVF